MGAAACERWFIIGPSAPGNVLFAEVGHPTKSGDGIVTITLKIDSESVQWTAPTGDPNDPDDEIPKSGKDKGCDDKTLDLEAGLERF